MPDLGTWIEAGGATCGDTVLVPPGHYQRIRLPEVDCGEHALTIAAENPVLDTLAPLPDVGAQEPILEVSTETLLDHFLAGDLTDTVSHVQEITLSGSAVHDVSGIVVTGFLANRVRIRREPDPPLEGIARHLIEGNLVVDPSLADRVDAPYWNVEVDGVGLPVPVADAGHHQCIHVWFADHVTVRNNQMWNCGTWGSNAASFTLNGSDEAPNTNHLVENNTIRGGVDLEVEAPALVFDQTHGTSRFVDSDGDGLDDCAQVAFDPYDPLEGCPEHYGGLGVDGILIERSGVNTWVRHNLILDQHHLLDDDGTPGGDDGDGIDLKMREVDARDAHLVVKDNTIANTEGAGIIIHFGAQGLEVDGNHVLFSDTHGISVLTMQSCAHGGSSTSVRRCWATGDSDCDSVHDYNVLLAPPDGIAACDSHVEWYRDLWIVNNVVAGSAQRALSMGALSKKIVDCDLDDDGVADGADCPCWGSALVCVQMECTRTQDVYVLFNTLHASGGRSANIEGGFVESIPELSWTGPCDPVDGEDDDGDGVVDETHGPAAEDSVWFAGNLLTEGGQVDGAFDGTEHLIVSYGNAWAGPHPPVGEPWADPALNCLPAAEESCDPGYFLFSWLLPTRTDATFTELASVDWAIVEQAVGGTYRTTLVDAFGNPVGSDCPGAFSCN